MDRITAPLKHLKLLSNQSNASIIVYSNRILFASPTSLYKIHFQIQLTSDDSLQKVHHHIHLSFISHDQAPLRGSSVKSINCSVPFSTPFSRHQHTGTTFHFLLKRVRCASAKVSLCNRRKRQDSIIIIICSLGTHTEKRWRREIRVYYYCIFIARQGKGYTESQRAHLIQQLSPNDVSSSTASNVTRARFDERLRFRDSGFEPRGHRDRKKWPQNSG